MNHLRRSRSLSSAMRWSLAAVWCVAWLMVAVTQDAIAQDKAAKAVVPTTARQTAVRKLLDETFEISKANSATKKQQAAQKLMEMAGNPATTGDELYVVLVTALPLLRDAGDFPTYLAAVEQLTESFQVDAEAERTKYVIDFMATCKSSTTLEPALNEVVAMIGRAANKNQYRAANELLDVADRHAKRAAATKLSKLLIDVRGSLREREQAFIAKTQAQKTLADKPDDPKANLAVGLWLAVYESDWEQALPKLVLGSDTKWKAAAAAEPKSPAEVEGQLAAADAWWEVAQSATGDAKLAAQRRAHEWYKLHEPHVKSPLVKARVTKRLEELAANLETVSPRTPASSSQPKPAIIAPSKAGKANELPIGKWIDLLEMVKLPENALLGKWQKRDGALICEPSQDATFMIPVAMRGSYELRCEFTRRTGSAHVAVVIPVGTASSSVILSGWGGAVSGLQVVDGQEAKDIGVSTGAIVRPGKLVNGQRYQLQIEVTQNAEQAAVTAALNGQRFVVWSGRVSQLSATPWYGVPCLQAMGVTVSESLTDVHKLEVRLTQGGMACLLGEDWKNSIAPVAPSPPREIAAKCLTWKGRKYFFSDKPMKFPEAQQLATVWKGRLLTISSAEEEAFLYEQGRGLAFWMSAWRRTESNDWRDERNRPLRFMATWQKGEPRLGYRDLQLALKTDALNRGLNDCVPWENFYACIEWGEEYPDDK